MSNQLFLLSLADIFSIYPKIFNELLAAEEQRRILEGVLEKDYINLPSDVEWKEIVYYRLLEVQKKVNQALDSGLELEEINKKSEKPIWNPNDILKNITTSIDDRISKERRKCLVDHPIDFVDVSLLGTWSLECISKAGKLLKRTPIPVTFNDEHEMRKIYSLIYDVFRYKHVLIEALKDISFYAHFPELKNDESRIWLMLFELHTRHFLRRPAEEIEIETRLYKEAELDYIAKCLWAHRIRLAASISRLRIKKGALHLSQLLPPHLQDERVALAAANPIVSGWMNPFRLKDKEKAVEMLNKMGLTEVFDKSSEEKPLQEDQFKWDKVCPLFMTCIPKDRSKFSQSEMVRQNYFILQDRTFSIAPAILSKLLDHFQLEGDIVQTHVASPRTTAYLAALFRSVNRVYDFIAYGAGPNLPEYKDYMSSLAIDNVRIHSENFCKLNLNSIALDAVVGIFATPPNSYSGVADPIDLICSRGGDLNMLEVLTESEMSSEGKKRVTLILEEQRETLRLAMSRPQVQFVLYQTYSIIGAENQDMIQRSVDDVNRCAFEKHVAAYREKKRLEALAEAELANIPSVAQSGRKRGAGGGGGGGTSAKSDESVAKKRFGKDVMGISKDSAGSNLEINESTEDLSEIVKVPKTDEFFVAEVPDMCLNQDKCISIDSGGCFVSLIQRKKVTKLDAKYLIQMAEDRGLFGSGDKKKSAKPKSSKKPEKKIDKKDHDNANKKRIRKDDVAGLIERLNQPTHSSANRSNVQSFSSVKKQSIPFNVPQRTCARHNKHHGEENVISHRNSLQTTTLQFDSRAKRWWKETTNHLKKIRAIETHKPDSKLMTVIPLVDEVVLQLPPLKLSRDHPTTVNSFTRNKSRSKIRVPYPVTVTHLEFHGYTANSQKYGRNMRNNSIPNEHSFYHPPPNRAAKQSRQPAQKLPKKK